MLNKIDLPSAEPDRVAREIEEVVGLDASDVLLVSAKEGKGVAELLERIVERVPAPEGDRDAPTRALVFDSWFDPYVGAVLLVRVVDGRLSVRDRVRFMATGSEQAASPPVPTTLASSPNSFLNRATNPVTKPA